MKYALVIFLALPALAAADERPPIASDRPGFSDGSSVVSKGTLQLESGYFRTFLNSGNTISLGDTLVRLGVSDNAEVRLIGLSYGFAPGNTQSLLDPSIGFKLRLQKPSQSLPEITFVGQTTVPIGSHPIRANQWNPTAKIAVSKAVGNDSIGGNLVYAKLGSSGSSFDQVAVSLYFSRPLSARTSLTPEFWVVNRIGPGNSGAAFGSIAGTYLVNSNTQVDLRVGSGFNQSRDGWFLQAGFSRRF